MVPVSVSRRTAHVALWALALLISLPVRAASGLEATQEAFRQIHQKVMPAVVSINSSGVRTADPGDDLFNFFFGTPSQPRIERASGSGVIIRADGIVLTNSHVVANATKVTVTLSNSDKALPAEVVQSDPRTDLAIVRITEKGTYPTAVLGDGSTVRVGDWAIAFGSPFRLAASMTAGIISATGRKLPSPDSPYDYRDLLQTDASINPGNSGGPLVNINGEVVGINFMIFSPGSSAGSVGIGFAIPINDYTRRIIDTMASGKAVERGQLGVGIKNLDTAMRDQFGVKDGGVFVDQVMPGQAADRAGVKEEDVIISFAGQRITDVDQFIRLVELTAPGTKTTLVVVRDKKEVKLEVTIGAAATAATPAKTTATDERKLGLTVMTLTEELVQRFRLTVIVGVLVAQVQPDSAAADAGLRRGDIILRVGTTEVRTRETFWTAVNDAFAKSDNGVLLRVRRGDANTTLTLKPAEEGDGE